MRLDDLDVPAFMRRTSLTLREVRESMMRVTDPAEVVRLITTHPDLFPSTAKG